HVCTHERDACAERPGELEAFFDRVRGWADRTCGKAAESLVFGADAGRNAMSEGSPRSMGVAVHTDDSLVADVVLRDGSTVRLRDPRAAEAAFAVADDYQGRGIGTRMLEQLAEAASGAGIEEFVAEVMADNAAMLGVLSDAGFETTRATALGETEVRLRVES